MLFALAMFFLVAWEWPGPRRWPAAERRCFWALWSLALLLGAAVSLGIRLPTLLDWTPPAYLRWAERWLEPLPGQRWWW
ncbi:MAG: hypothetical protein IRZ26_06035 [Clostridia bacterium]|nr:hypothetical protein [Clostridia bacterium]MCL6521516.1 hypothetical protein [Bacillota bacterium]